VVLAAITRPGKVSIRQSVGQVEKKKKKKKKQKLAIAGGRTRSVDRRRKGWSGAKTFSGCGWG